MKDIYRKSALDRIASEDQLDKVLKVTSPMSWLALAGVTLMISVVLIWSVVGSLPSTITASGVIVSSNTSTNTVLATQRGTIQGVVPSGEEIRMETPVAQISLSGGNADQTGWVLSDQVGRVSEVLVQKGDTVENGTEILRVVPRMTQGQKEVAVCYVPVSVAGKIRRGMDAYITLNSAESSTYGHMFGRVINVDSWATSQKGMAAVVGNDNSMTTVLNQDGKGVCAVACEIRPDPSTRSGYDWSNRKGASREIAAPQMCSVRIITERVAPITKLFSKLKDIWENRG